MTLTSDPYATESSFDDLTITPGQRRYATICAVTVGLLSTAVGMALLWFGTGLILYWLDVWSSSDPDLTKIPAMHKVMLTIAAVGVLMVSAMISLRVQNKTEAVFLRIAAAEEKSRLLGEQARQLSSDLKKTSEGNTTTSTLEVPKRSS